MEVAVTLKKFLQDKALFVAAFSLATGFMALPASASCIATTTTFCDSTPVRAFTGSQFDSSYKTNGFISGVGDAVESAGDPFNTDELVTSLTEGRTTETLELTFFTSFNGNELGAHYADIFLGTNVKSPDSFGYAIALGNQTDKAGLYKLNSPSSYETSEQIWSGKKGTIYGGEYYGLNNQWNYSPTVVTSSATKDSAFTTTVTETPSKLDTDVVNGQTFGYMVDVKLTASITDFNALFGSGLSVFWGTADCSNDPIEAVLAFAPTRVPEPLTLSLFGVGIGGVLLSRRRRRAQ